MNDKKCHYRMSRMKNGTMSMTIDFENGHGFMLPLTGQKEFNS